MQEEQFCEIIFIFDQWFRRTSGGPCVRWSGTIYAISVEGIMGNLHVK